MSTDAGFRPPLHGGSNRLSSTLALAHCAASRQEQRGTEEFDDLLNDSRVGLIRGLERFDRQRGVHPSSYLLSRATGQILH